MNNSAGEEGRIISSTRQRIDRHDRFIFVDESWILFARQNWIDGFTGADVLGRSVWDFISGEGVRQLWKIILQQVRTGNLTVSFPYRCDSPGYRRHMSMEVVCASDMAVEMLNRVLRIERRASISLLDKGARRSRKLLPVCSWCKKIRVEQAGDPGHAARWLEVEEAITELGLFEPEILPELSHEVCEDCYRLVIRQVQASRM